MRRAVAIVLYVLAALVALLGVTLAAQIDAPVWQSILLAAFVLLIAGGIAALGRRAMKGRRA